MRCFAPGLLAGLVLAASGSGCVPTPPDFTPGPPSPGPAPKPEWTEFSPANKAFTVLAPTMSGDVTKKNKLEDGSELTHHMFFSGEDNNPFVIDMMDAPFDVSEEGRKGFYDTMRDRDMASRTAKTIYEKDVTIDGFAGREHVFEQPTKHGSQFYKMRSLLVGRRYFVLMAVYHQESVPPSVDRFLGSFHPAKPKAGAAEALPSKP